MLLKNDIDTDPDFAPAVGRPLVSDEAVRWLCGTAMVLGAMGLVAWLAVVAPEMLAGLAIFGGVAGFLVLTGVIVLAGIKMGA